MSANALWFIKMSLSQWAINGKIVQLFWKFFLHASGSFEGPFCLKRKNSKTLILVFDTCFTVVKWYKPIQNLCIGKLKFRLIEITNVNHLKVVHDFQVLYSWTYYCHEIDKGTILCWYNSLKLSTSSEN